MTTEAKFEVFVSGYSTSLEEWKRALRAPLSELPELNVWQKEIARKFGISEEEYARSHLSSLYGQERMRSRARELGKAVEEILESLGHACQLTAVVAELSKERWVLRIQTPQKIVSVAVPRDLADDVVDSDTVQDKDRLEALLVSSLKRGEVIEKR